MINEKHARCVLPVSKKVHFAPPLFKKKQITKSETDTTESWSMRYFSWSAWVWDIRRRRELLKALIDGKKVVDVSCMTV